MLSCTKSGRYLYCFECIQLIPLIYCSFFSFAMKKLAKQEPRKSFQLSAIEYFIVCLLRYPIVQPLNSLAIFPIDGWESLSANSVASWIQTSPYFYLLSQYLNRYLVQSGGMINGGIGVSYGTRDAVIAELLVRLAVDQWIDIVPVVRVNHGQIVGQGKKGLRNTDSVRTSPISGPDLAEFQFHPPATEVLTLSLYSVTSKWTPLTLKVYLT